MDNLLRAIKNQYDSGGAAYVALRDANTGGLYLTEAFQLPDIYPYIVLLPVAGSYLHIFSTAAEINRIDDTLIQFSFYSDVFSEVMTIYGLFKTAFDDINLTYPGGQNSIIMRRVSETGPNKLETIWQFIVEYRCQRGS